MISNEVLDKYVSIVGWVYYEAIVLDKDKDEAMRLLNRFISQYKM